MKKLICSTALILVLVLFNGCGLGAQAPDKHISATLELKKDNPTETEIAEAVAKIEERFAHFGVLLKSIEVSSEGQIQLELETFADADNVRRFLTIGANLEFYLCFRPEEFLPYKVINDDLLAMENDSVAHPFLDLISNEGEYAFKGIFSSKVSDTVAVNDIIRRNLTPKFFVDDKTYTKFIWSRKPDENNYLTMYAVKTDKDGKAPIDGSYITQAEQVYDMADRPGISMAMNAEGAKIWEDLTYEAYQSRKQIAISIDDQVYSAPGLTNGSIKGGLTQITGNFTEEEAHELAQLISSGALPPMSLVEFTVEPLD